MSQPSAESERHAAAARAWLCDPMNRPCCAEDEGPRLAADAETRLAELLAATAAAARTQERERIADMVEHDEKSLVGDCTLADVKLSETIRAGAPGGPPHRSRR